MGASALVALGAAVTGLLALLQAGSQLASGELFANLTDNLEGWQDDVEALRKQLGEVRELDDLRSFWPAMRVQPLVGATAGLIVLLVIETGTLDVGGESGSWAGRALVAFVAGFSEPFFLGLVQRVAVIPDKRSEESDVEAPPETAEESAGR